MEQETLALELLRELKKSGQRKFIIIIILIIALVGTNIGWLIYNSQYETVDEVSSQSIDDIDNSNDSSYTQTIN